MQFKQPKLTNKRGLMVCPLRVLKSVPELYCNYCYYFILLRTVLGRQVREITVGRQACKPPCSSQEFKLVPLTDVTDQDGTLSPTLFVSTAYSH